MSPDSCGLLVGVRRKSCEGDREGEAEARRGVVAVGAEGVLRVRSRRPRRARLPPPRLPPPTRSRGIKIINKYIPHFFNPKKKEKEKEKDYFFIFDEIKIRVKRNCGQRSERVRPGTQMGRDSDVTDESDTGSTRLSSHSRIRRTCGTHRRIIQV